MWRRSPNPSIEESSITDDRITDWLVSECHTVGAYIANLALVGERIMATTAAVGSLAASVAISNGKGYLLMGLPFALSVVTTYKLYLNQDSMALRGYKAGLEEEIFRRTGVPVIQYESRVHRSGHNRVQTATVAALVCLALIASGVVALNEALATRQPGHWGHTDSAWYLTLTIASMAVGYSATLVCLWPLDRTKHYVADLVRSSIDQSHTS